MTDRIRRFWSAVLRWANLRPPRGHMDMLRDVMGRREEDRVARHVATEKRQARGGTTPHRTRTRDA